MITTEFDKKFHLLLKRSTNYIAETFHCSFAVTDSLISVRGSESELFEALKYIMDLQKSEFVFFPLTDFEKRFLTKHKQIRNDQDVMIEFHENGLEVQGKNIDTLCNQIKAILDTFVRILKTV